MDQRELARRKLSKQLGQDTESLPESDKENKDPVGSREPWLE